MMEKNIPCVGIIGYGKMGADIFYEVVSQNMSVVLYTFTQSKLLDAANKFSRIKKRLQKNGLTHTADLCCASDLSDFKNCDIIIETVSEDINVKRNIYQTLDKHTDKKTILTTNTSSISIEELAHYVKDQAKFCGMHFFYPIKLNDIVEIICTTTTSESTISSVETFVNALGMDYVKVRDAPASAINLILSFYYVESLYILQERLASPATIDRIAKEYFYVGPCESLDIIGLDFFYESISRVADKNTVINIHDNKTWKKPDLIDKLISQGRLGRKTGCGLYHYDAEYICDNSLDEDLNLHNQETSIFIEKEIRQRLFYSLVNGCMVAARLGLCTEHDVDKGIKKILLMSKGPLQYISEMPKENVIKTFQDLATNYGQRFILNQEI